MISDNEFLEKFGVYKDRQNRIFIVIDLGHHHRGHMYSIILTYRGEIDDTPAIQLFEEVKIA